MHRGVMFIIVQTKWLYTVRILSANLFMVMLIILCYWQSYMGICSENDIDLTVSITCGMMCMHTLCYCHVLCCLDFCS